jgi:hypothetical protein
MDDRITQLTTVLYASCMRVTMASPVILEFCEP